jgi:hypothetical protein
MTNPIKKPTSPPNPTVVNSGLKSVAAAAKTVVRALSIAAFHSTSLLFLDNFQ